ncbi:MAG: adenine-specific methyltransferase EcoRI family protein [Bacteroidetes bacterium]|nr:adenine-specific methyltransferase EcoRI family protein [Bacteroidota bacterium]
MANKHLSKAKNTKNDEFYTQYHDIEKEITAYLEYNPKVFRNKTILLPCDDPEWSNFTIYFAQNFEKLGLKKLISTSFAPESKKYKLDYKPSLFEIKDAQYDSVKTIKNGKIFTLTRKTSLHGRLDLKNLEWHYLKGNGDFKSDEIIKLRDESDIIVTNPPFSLFREFLSWVLEVNKQFIVIGNLNAITYKEVFPLIKNNKIWLGNGFHGGNAYFSIPFHKEYAEGVYNPDTGLVKFRNVCWFTNLDHGKRHQPLPLMTLNDNIKFSKHKEIKGKQYQEYENYNAIEVPFTDAIPSDYRGVMGVPISFLSKYSPEQFEIIKFRHGDDNKDLRLENGDCPYFRILIKHKKIQNENNIKNKHHC